MLIAGKVSPSGIRSTGAEWILLSDHHSTPKPPRLDSQPLFDHSKSRLVRISDPHTNQLSGIKMVTVCVTFWNGWLFHAGHLVTIHINPVIYGFLELSKNIKSQDTFQKSAAKENAFRLEYSWSSNTERSKTKSIRKRNILKFVFLMVRFSNGRNHRYL